MKTSNNRNKSRETRRLGARVNYLANKIAQHVVDNTPQNPREVSEYAIAMDMFVRRCDRIAKEA